MTSLDLLKDHPSGKAQSQKSSKSYCLSILIPAYNEEENIQTAIQKLEQTLMECQAIEDHEFIIVDDHSSDATFQRVQSFNQKKIKGIRLSRRSGSHTALRVGLAHAQGDLVLCISADGQEDPAILNQMIEKMKDGCHAVWGVRKKREESLINKFFALAAYRLIHLFIKNEENRMDLSNADFFLLSKKFVNAINACKERHTSLLGLVQWLGFKQDFVLYDRKARARGKSKWSFRSRLRLAIDWIVAFSGIPLKLISLVGFGTAILGILYALFIMVYSLLGYTAPGWAETVILILILGGVQMVMLGVIGEYLWRTLDETRNRPLYFIEEMTEQD